MMKLAKHAMGHRNFSVELSKDLKNTSVLISATFDDVERASFFLSFVVVALSARKKPFH